jgi:hypothetical protein
MERDFDPQQFLLRILSGEFDGDLQDALRKLSADQLEQVAMLMVGRSTANNAAKP